MHVAQRVLLQETSEELLGQVMRFFADGGTAKVRLLAIRELKSVW